MRMVLWLLLSSSPGIMHTEVTPAWPISCPGSSSTPSGEIIGGDGGGGGGDGGGGHLHGRLDQNHRSS